MSRKVEDILGGDEPERAVQEEPQGWSKKLALYFLRLLKSGGPEQLTTTEREELWARIDKTVNNVRRHRPVVLKILIPSAAACIAAIVLTVWWFEPFRRNEQPPIAIAAKHNQTALLDTGAIRLKGGGDPTLILGDEDIVDVSTFDRGTEQSDVFKTLTVPYGKRTEMVFPDGSKVWLNAGSQLTFPEIFNSEKREVYLDGEGYFEIAKDSERPFYVYTNDILIKVLGTTFNISSYREDSFTSTVLLSGQIELQSSGNSETFKKQVLHPGSAAIWQRNEKKLEVRQDNAEDHISWTRKQLILRNTPLDELLVRLGRIYNTKIISDSPTLDDETFSGRLDLTQPLLNLLHILYDVQEYAVQQEERRIVIRRK